MRCASLHLPHSMLPSADGASPGSRTTWRLYATLAKGAMSPQVCLLNTPMAMCPAGQLTAVPSPCTQLLMAC